MTTTGQPPDVRFFGRYTLLAGMAGTLMLARAVDDPALSDRILLAGCRLYGRAFDAEREATSGEGNQ